MCWSIPLPQLILCPGRVLAAGSTHNFMTAVLATQALRLLTLWSVHGILKIFEVEEAFRILRGTAYQRSWKRCDMSATPLSCTNPSSAVQAKPSAVQPVPEDMRQQRDTGLTGYQKHSHVARPELVLATATNQRNTCKSQHATGTLQPRDQRRLSEAQAGAPLHVHLLLKLNCSTCLTRSRCSTQGIERK